MTDLLHASPEDRALVVPVVSQLGRVLPPNWGIAEVNVHGRPDGGIGVSITVASASATPPEALDFFMSWSPGVVAKAQTDEEVRAEFDRHFARSLTTGRGGAA